MSRCVVKRASRVWKYTCLIVTLEWGPTNAAPATNTCTVDIIVLTSTRRKRAAWFQDYCRDCQAGIKFLRSIPPGRCDPYEYLTNTAFCRTFWNKAFKIESLGRLLSLKVGRPAKHLWHPEDCGDRRFPESSFHGTSGEPGYTSSNLRSQYHVSLTWSPWSPCQCWGSTVSTWTLSSFWQKRWIYKNFQETCLTCCHYCNWTDVLSSSTKGIV